MERNGAEPRQQNMYPENSAKRRNISHPNKFHSHRNKKFKITPPSFQAIFFRYCFQTCPSSTAVNNMLFPASGWLQVLLKSDFGFSVSPGGLLMRVQEVEFPRIWRIKGY